MIRERESQAVPINRKAQAKEFDLAERMLNAGFAIITNTTVKHPSDDARAGRIMLGLYGKILNNLLSIVVLSERGLPTASLMRELTEALISFAFISTDPSRLAQLYVDGVALRAEQDLNRRKATGDPEIVVHPEDENAFGERLVEMESRVGPDRLEEMRGWRQRWAEGKTVEQMVKAAHLPSIVYVGAYAMDSMPVHAMDAADYLELDDDDNLMLRIPGRTTSHLMPAMAATLYGVDIMNRVFALGREGTVKGLREEIETLNRQRRQQAPQ